MRNSIKLIAALAIFSVAVATAFYLKQRDVDREASLNPVSTAVHEPGIVRFPVGAAQLSSIHAESVKLQSMPAADPVNGRLVYDEGVTSRVSSPLVGRVLRVRVGPGDKVKRGDALLEMDSPEFASVESDLAKALSDENRKRLAFQRAQRLYENEVIAGKDFEAAQADFQQAQADARRASLRLKNLQASGHEDGKFILRSPITGTVVERHVNLGQELRPDLEQPLFLITDSSRLWVLVEVPEKYLAHIHTGQTLSLETDAWPDQRFLSSVERIGLAVDPATRRVQVRGSILNKEGQLKPEMYAKVSFLASDDRRGIKVLNASLVTQGMYAYVFVETQAGVFEKRQVTLALRGLDHSFVESGLKEGERIVTEGALLLNSEVSIDAR